MRDPEQEELQDEQKRLRKKMPTLKVEEIETKEGSPQPPKAPKGGPEEPVEEQEVEEPVVQSTKAPIGAFGKKEVTESRAERKALPHSTTVGGRNPGPSKNDSKLLAEVDNIPIEAPVVAGGTFGEKEEKVEVVTKKKSPPKALSAKKTKRQDLPQEEEEVVPENEGSSGSEGSGEEVAEEGDGEESLVAPPKVPSAVETQNSPNLEMQEINRLRYREMVYRGGLKVIEIGENVAAHVGNINILGLSKALEQQSDFKELLISVAREWAPGLSDRVESSPTMQLLFTIVGTAGMIYYMNTQIESIQAELAQLKKQQRQREVDNAIGVQQPVPPVMSSIG